MKAEFWHEKWEAQQVGFHLKSINPLLKTHWSKLNLPSNTRVFVPLCGKSLDMCFLAQLGHQVIGCELSDIAVQQFFKENRLNYKVSGENGHHCYSANLITIYQGDFFSIPTNQPKAYQGFYDRASLIAWPDEMRESYAKKLASLLTSGARGLLISLDYPQELKDGPPFAVSDDWINRHLSKDFEIELLSSKDVLEDNAKFVDKGVPWLTESVYKLVRK